MVTKDKHKYQFLIENYVVTFSLRFSMKFDVMNLYSAENAYYNNIFGNVFTVLHKSTRGRQ